MKWEYRSNSYNNTKNVYEATKGTKGNQTRPHWGEELPFKRAEAISTDATTNLLQRKKGYGQVEHN